MAFDINRKRKAEIARDLDSYISTKRRKPITAMIRGLLSKREKRPKEEDVPLERIEETIERGAIQKGKAPLYMSSVVVEEKPALGRYYEQLKGIFSKKREQEETEALEDSGGVSMQEQEFEKEAEELEREEEQLGKKRLFFGGFFSNLFKKDTYYGGYDAPSEGDIDEEPSVKKLVLERPEVEKDMKQMALITQEILKRLPPEELQDFKVSGEFAVYKDILKKYSLIREEKK